MSSGVGDLIPIFLAEARERLAALKEHLGGVESDPGAREEVRRQLHGLKGAARMLGLNDLASQCHRGEDLITGEGPVGREELLTVLRQIEAGIEELEVNPGAAASRDALQEGARPRRGRLGRSRLVRQGAIAIPADVLDNTTERATRLRHLAGAEAAGIEELFELSRFAEAGVGDQEPRQVLATLAISLRQLAMELDRTHGNMLELLRQSQEELVRVHRQPLRPFLRRLSRHAEELARALGKEVEVSVECGDVTLDRRLMGALEEPILHLVRNAVDHGFESAEERRAAGKPPARLRLGARTEGATVCLWVEDDGRGIHVEDIVRRAREMGLLPEGDEGSLTRAELLNLVFRPGFSTASSVTEISGRGIGLDAVAAAVHRLGGRVQLDSEPGKGTRVSLFVPAVRRGESVLVVAAAGQLAAVPSAHVLRFVRYRRDQVSATEDGRNHVVVEGRQLQIHNLSRIFGEEPTGGLLTVLSAGETEVGLIVDRSVGEEEVVLRPFPRCAGLHPIFESVTVLSNGAPVPVLSARLLAGLGPDDLPELLQMRRSRRLRVLVADDSRVAQGMLRRALEDGDC
ncbi:MAG TPA: hypothetical protein ENK19_09990, partial [Acidobacteria bacterium]|nr:hypothetical protein [Acidobacteriota bacterium]